jgi:predicted ATPase
MLKSITIENFFSFGEAQKIELNSGVNILIGINGSGKSNFIKALKVLSYIISSKNSDFRKLFLQTWGGVDNVAFYNDSNKPIKITYEFEPSFIVFNMTPYFMLKNLYYELKLSKNGTSSYKQEGVFYAIDTSTNEKKILSDNQDFDTAFLEAIKNNEVEGLPIKFLAQPILSYEKFDVSERSDLRKAGDSFIENYLLPNGINLYALLNDLNINQSKTYDEIEKQLQEVNPNFKNIVSKPLGSKFLYFLKEKGLDKAIDFQFISDGTLQYLLLLSIFFNPQRGQFVTLDEPDNNLHPDMINGIAKGIKHAAATGTQMIIATHSPLLLNDFELKDILIFEKDKNNQSIVNRKSIKEFEHWEGDFLVGQMWLSGQLGGVRW